MSGDLDLELVESLTPRDRAILETLRMHRLASTVQLRRLHFTEPFGSTSAATRAAQRVLLRLENRDLIARLNRRIGGARKGSASLIWQLGSAGDRVLAMLHNEKRRRNLEPNSGGFVRHGLAVTALAVSLHEALAAGEIDELQLTGEPRNWLHFLGLHGRPEILKPDLTALAVAGDFEDHLFIERDLGTEHAPAIAKKALIYQRYAQTGRYQAEHGLFPAVVWVVSDTSRQAALERALRNVKGLTPGIHRVVTEAGFLPAVLAGGDVPP